ncbi:YdeI/OmpD-associated family protein [Agromyces salentinus]|uniref:YdeI/OmpD-associated family protein n=1 Tax=Agromyces salentinus TaxID=269421 RepID=UPI001FE81EA7|nr:YdeI/OmpD-associated family protein [Agromyces salentinus]
MIEALGAGRKPPVVVTVNGFEYRSTVAVMGGRYLIGFSADKRAQTGIRGGDPIVVDLEVDTAPRTVEVPDDLAAALEASGGRAAFDALSPSARKAHVTNVEAAKAPETRQRRIEAIVAKLS